MPLGNSLAIAMPQERFENDAQRHRQARHPPDIGGNQSRQ